MFRRLSGGGQILTALLLIVLGLLLMSGIVEALLSIIGWVLIIAGIVVGVLGIVGLFTNRRRHSLF